MYLNIKRKLKSEFRIRKKVGAGLLNSFRHILSPRFAIGKKKIKTLFVCVAFVQTFCTNATISIGNKGTKRRRNKKIKQGKGKVG